ncbi:hypothetical protein N5P37_006932 [Trichoderma harzianum]|uniref:Uncharacterized protein n=1 Tax=Trichoderma harzianum CBS 226.95 TaxID=983964 RepID=A0A2T4A2B7_TRIHA|nr:hypothetical protein M431DRAFT_498459 [Trichoderma harzianum CBS 226.95]KAK0760734.1 hypothetical protein N5P37_006932 [Trichoderma harzianum]PKK49379.1 hypothetical protein CI102_6007 [Trichoderma harzianum]PTB51206.1 hypothetical protein M431DRAFT_498459 [Trichoderma harzianum CBS 226.95]
MSQATSFTYENSTPVEKKRNWRAMILSSMIGGVAVILSFFAISALTPPGEVCFIVVTTVWGIFTRIAGNILGSERMTYILRQDLIQQSYRKTIDKYIGSALENAVTSIRKQEPSKFQKTRFYFDVDHKLRFTILEKRRLFFDLSYKVTTPSATSHRPLHQGVSAPDLPNYEPQSTRTVITEAKSLIEGIRHGAQEGALLGLASGALAILLCLVFGKFGIFLGIIGATILLAQRNHSAIPLATPDKTALTEEFGREALQQVMRLMRCAHDNTVGLELGMQVWSTAVETEDAHPKIGASSIILHFDKSVPLMIKEGEQDGRSLTQIDKDGSRSKNEKGQRSKNHSTRISL